MVKNIYLALIIICLSSISLYSQAQQTTMYTRGGLFSGGYLTMTNVALPNGSGSDYTWISPVQTASSSGNYNLNFSTATSGSTAGKYWGDNNATVAVNTPVTFLVSSSDAHWVIVSGRKYVFTFKDVANGVNSAGYIFEFVGTPATITTATNTTPSANTDVTVTANMSGALATNQTVYVRWSTSSTYATSTVTQMTGSASTYTATIPGQAGGTTVYYYCFSSGVTGLTSANCNPATISASAATSYSISGNSPTLLVTPTALTGFGYFPGSGPSASQTYSLSGTFLTGFPGSITVSSPADYEISTDNGTTWGTSGTVAYTSATLSSTTVSVRLKAGLSQGNYNLENTANAGGGATTVNVACSGTVLKSAPTAQATGFTASNGSPSTTVINFVWTDAGGSPTPDGYLIRGSLVGYSSIVAPVNGTAVPSAGLDMNAAQGVQAANITGLTQGTTYYFNIYSYTNSGTNILYNLVSPQQSTATTTLSTYYSKSTGSLDVLSTWGPGTDGSGTPPASFTTDGLTFIIKNNPSPTIVGAWTVSGATSRIQVGDSTTGVNFTVPYTLTATNLDIMNNAAVTLGSAVTLTGTVNVKSGGTLNCSTYIVSGTAGIFNLLSGGRIMIGSPLGITTSGTNGNIQTTGARTYNASGIYVYNGTASQVTGNGLPASITGSLKISNILSTVTLSQATAIGVGGTCTIDSSAALTTGGYTFSSNTGVVTVNGSFQIDTGGWGGSTGTYIYGSGATLIYNATSQYGVNTDAIYWPVTNGPTNVNCKGSGGILLNTARTVPGVFQVSGPVALTAALTLNGTCQINSTGSFTNAPSYGASSTLIYNQGGTKTRGNEWTAVTSGAGYPNNVQVSNSTTLGMSTTAAQCAGNITIDTASTLTTTSSTLTVLGNVSIKGTMSLAGNVIANKNWTVTGTQNNNLKTVSFSGTTLQTIAGPAAFDNLVINNVAGVGLSSICMVNDTLTLTNGLFNTTSLNLLTLGAAAIVSGGTNTSFVNGPVALTARLTIPMIAPIGKGSAYRPLTTVFTALNGTGTLTAEQFETPPSGVVNITGVDAISHSRYYRIDKSSSITGGNTNVTISWGADDNVTDPTSITVCSQADGSGWTFQNHDGGYTLNASGGNVTTGSLDINTITGNYAIGNLIGGGNPLPVNLTSFSAISSNGAIKLYWKTSVETNNHGFNVERSIDKFTWGNLIFIEGQGNSSSSKSYSYVDNTINKIGKYYYRLKQVDNNGAFKYSNTVECDFALPTVYSLNQNYPNPFNPNTMISYSLPKASNVKITVYNAIGETVTVLENGFKSAGNFTVTFNASEMPSGIYFYRIEAEKFSQVKKMMLLK